ncbi:MAG: DUF4760 domain-containing protein [Azospirillaceae bacterium]
MACAVTALPDGTEVLVCGGTGPGWTFWAILLSAVVALFSVAASRVATKRRAAIDLIVRSESGAFQESRAVFKDVLANGVLLNLLNPRSAEDFSRRRSVQELLNHYELVAISIRENIVDENIMKLYQRRSVIDYWDDAKEIVTEARRLTENDNIFHNFEWLAERWRLKPNVDSGPTYVAGKVFSELFGF